MPNSAFWDEVYLAFLIKTRVYYVGILQFETGPAIEQLAVSCHG
jgi:hypothetical protein